MVSSYAFEMVACERDVGEYVSFVPCVSMVAASEREGAAARLMRLLLVS